MLTRAALAIGATGASGTVSVRSNSAASVAFVLLWVADQEIQSDDAGTPLSHEADFKNYVAEELTYFPLPGPSTSQVGWTFSASTDWLAAALTQTR